MARGDGGDFCLAAGISGEHLDDFVLNEGGVHVEADEALRAASEARALDGDVHADLGRQCGEGFAQRHAATRGGVGNGEVELQAGDRVIRDAADRVDVRAVVGEGLADAGNVRGG